DKDLIAVNAGTAFDWTGFVGPFLFAGGKIEGIQISVHRADKDRAIYDGGGSLDRVLDLEFPADDELVGQRRAGHAGLQGIAAEDGPILAGFSTRDLFLVVILGEEDGG